MKLSNNTNLESQKKSADLSNNNGNGNQKQKVIIIFGPPGSGKGSQADLLSKKFYFYNLETSKVLEEKFKKARSNESIEVDGKKYLIADEAKLWREGILCSPTMVTYLIKKQIEEIYSMRKSLIMTGSPRTLYEAQQLMPYLKEKFGKENISVIFLKLTAKQTIFRNTNRRICELMRHPILYTKENAHLTRCPLDGSKLLRRKGLDSPETIKVRLKEYEQRTLPLLNYFKEQGLEIKTINAGQLVEKVLKDVLKALGKDYKNYEL
ncbi:MAG TPA: nucleoside monophosphate kinase [Candidatus Paceibacterota bacterium]|nr:nucleoside monophosphate kinase [Candidatus Pacearchaeota archaeon]HRZ50967.1 nucleoside monophosphate kinase [Candidatus Paceibacterota bacterium]HSA36688.1 nucleoside monophosphate kinase [Candidatus Paceibacterota bacterium]